MNEDRRLVTRIALRNYRSIAACDVSPAQLTFLVGPNGSGKSNFLDAIRFVADSLRFSLARSLRDRGGIGEVRRKSVGHPNRFGIRLELNLGESKGLYAFEIGADPNGGHRILREECCVLPRSGTPHHYRVKRGEMVGTSMGQAPAASEDRLFLVGASGVGVFRDVYDALSNTGFYDPRPEAIRDLRPPGRGDLLNHDGSNLASVLAGLAKRSPRIKRRIEEYLAKIVPGVAGVDRVPAGPRETLEFRRRVGGARHPWRFYASSASDGTLRACGVLVSLFQRAGDDGAEPWLIGIENPEATLHPAAVAVLADGLRDAAEHAQIVATSHSADLLDDLDIAADEVVAVRAENGETRLGPPDSVGRSALRDRLHTAGELLRANRLYPDPSLPRTAPGQLDLFEPLS